MKRLEKRIVILLKQQLLLGMYCYLLHWKYLFFVNGVISNNLRDGVWEISHHLYPVSLPSMDKRLCHLSLFDSVIS